MNQRQVSMNDISTTILIGSVEHGTSGDHKFWREDLFKTPRGQYFIKYAGGAESRYAVDQGSNLVVGSSGTRLLHEVEALCWCEAVGLDACVIAEHFA